MSDVLTLALRLQEIQADEAFWLNEAAGVRLRSQSYEQTRGIVGQAIREKYRPNPAPQDYYGPYIRDFFGDAAIFEHEGRTYQIPYTVATGNKVTLGEAIEVQIAYVPVATEATESQLDLGIAELVEAAKDGSTATIKIIGPQWGSSGYYGKDMLKAHASVFAEGTHMYIDHPGQGDRPERSVRDLAAVLTGTATWQEAGKQGPGLYAPARVLKPYQELVKEAAPHIGVSIRAAGRTRQGEAEGKRGPIVEAITGVASVDFVTRPGAGGRVAELFESARQRAWNTDPEGGQPVVEPTPSGLTEAQAAQLAQVATLTETVQRQAQELERLRLAATLREAHDLATSVIGASALHPNARPVLANRMVAGQLPLTEAGVLDREAFTTAINEAVTAEIAYLKSTNDGPVIRGMGSGGAQFSEAKPMDPEAKSKALKEAGYGIGLRGAELEAFAKVGV